MKRNERCEKIELWQNHRELSHERSRTSALLASCVVPLSVIAYKGYKESQDPIYLLGEVGVIGGGVAFGAAALAAFAYTKISEQAIETLEAQDDATYQAQYAKYEPQPPVAG